MIEIFVPGKLTNWANAGGYYGGPAEASYRKRWRTNTMLLAIAQRNTRPWPAGEECVPKHVHLHALVWNLFDSIDGLRNALKPVPDGLVKAKIIDDDSDRAPHTFEYTQELYRKARALRGVRITITPRPAGEEAG